MIVVLIASATLFLALFGTYQYFRNRSVIIDDLENLATISIHRLGGLLQSPLYDYNETAIEETINNEMTQKAIYAIFLRDMDKKSLILAKVRDTDWKITKTKEEIKGNFLIKSTPVVKDEETLGFVEIYVTYKFMQERLKKEIWILALTIVLLDLFLVFTLIISIQKIFIKPMNYITKALRESANQVSNTSEQVALSSRQMAEGASTQAAGIEETSSSLDEMASMTRRNADNADQADKLTQQTNSVVSEANRSMEELTGSMNEISEATGETQKIIKTIDDIAFQTNLLALNAAVEAARAGEAGAGFAVVADEVRNLALRAESAAKNTAEMIDGTAKRVEDGAALVTKTNEAFAKVAESAGKVGRLVVEIAAASNEQAQGIDQINQAVNSMDAITQQNSTNAEELTGSAGELSTESEKMKDIVNRLVILMEGRLSKGVDAEFMEKAMTKLPQTQPGKGGYGVAERKPLQQKNTGLTKNAGEVDPKLVIPIEDDDFKEF
jgi:methyl-accepting chemotaxis protein